MAASKDIGYKNYCHTVYTELSCMKSKLLDIIGHIEKMTGPEKKALEAHIVHFQELVKAIEWKLEIFSKVCITDFSEYAEDIESTVAVPQLENVSDYEPVPGGYVGG